MINRMTVPSAVKNSPLSWKSGTQPEPFNSFPQKSLNDQTQTNMQSETSSPSVNLIQESEESMDVPATLGFEPPNGVLLDTLEVLGEVCLCRPLLSHTGRTKSKCRVRPDDVWDRSNVDRIWEGSSLRALVTKLLGESKQ